MSSIDQVINRSRQEGEFTERREFSIARGQAIEKLREFALVDPHYYILELIQSAIANGATYIDIQCGDDEMVMSYIGGSFRENALAQLFDFLFASEDDLEHGPLRQLALGVNALMLFDPEEIVVESGNGSLAGTSRIAIRGDQDTVEVGRPDKPLEGTFVRARGLNRKKMNKRSSLDSFDGKPREYRAVEDRCLVAPVPILFNQNPLFGYSSQRTPKSLYGFGRTVSFDEGDLYGTIGVARRHSGAVFRLLTHGVWIESTRHTFEDVSSQLGGVVTFDRLRKTADHSSIVEDERYHEMWLRLRPYVNQLLSGETEADSYDVTTLSGSQLENRELLDLLRDSESIMLAPPTAAGEGPDYERAHKIGESLGLPVLCAPPDTREIVRTLGGRDVDFVVPDLSDDKVLHFYTRSEASLPARPWLIAPVELGTSSLLEAVDNLPMPGAVTSIRPRLSDDSVLEDASVSALRKAAWLLGEEPDEDVSLEEWKSRHLDSRGESIQATVYSPEDRDGSKRNVNVEVRTARRVVWEGESRAIAPGQVLVVNVSDIAPRRLWSSPEGEDKTVAQLLAEGVIRGHFSQLEEAADRGLRAALRAEVDPNTNAAQLVLSSLSQRVVKRIRKADDDQPRIQFSVVDPELESDVLQIPVLRNVDGKPVSLRDVERLMDHGQGLLYAVRADIEADLQGLDTSRILLVDESLEEMLISLIGPTAYCRVDDRDVIVEYEGLRCRDIAVGLRDYPQFPLLVEGASPDSWSEDRKRECVDMLVDKLCAVVESRGDNFESQELRRQAWRHLQWFATHRANFEFADTAGNQVDELPLFALADGRTCSYATLRRLLADRGHVEMLDGWAVGAGEMSFDEAVDRRIEVSDEDAREANLDFELKMNPFVLHLLGDVAQGVAEYHLSEKEMESVSDPDLQLEAMLERQIIDNDQARGVIGVPNREVDDPAVVVFSEESRQAVLREDLGETFGVIGKIRLRQGVDHEEVEDKITKVARDVLSHLLARLPQLASASDQTDYQRALSVLLDFAGGQIQLVGRRDSTIESRVHDALAREIFNAPLFPTTEGMPTSAMALVHDFQDRAGSAMARGQDFSYRPEMLADDIPEVLDGWLDRHLCVEQIHRPTTKQIDQQPRSDEERRPDADPTIRCAARTLEHWINVLHPDTEERRDGPGLHLDVAVDDEMFVGDLADEFCQLRDADSRGGDPILVVNRDHWMTRWLLAEGNDSGKPIAWAILGAYAHVNNMLEPVTNEHEMICQQRVAGALGDNRLTMIQAS